MSCPICCSPYTAKLRARLACPRGCGNSACRACIKRAILSDTSAPRCLFCRKEYDEEFLVLSLPKTFRAGPLREHRLRLALARQKSLLLETRPIIDRLRVADAEEQRAEALWLQADEVEDEGDPSTADQLRDEAAALEERAIGLREGELYDEVVDSAGRTGLRTLYCAHPGCEGTLNGSGECTQCSERTCLDCLRALGDDHTCAKEDLETVRCLQETCKPCPACGAIIEKARDGGCDQMWCTQCHSAFSWQTGARLLQGEIHNPHYLEHLKAENGALERSLGDLPCGGLCALESLQALPSDPALGYLGRVWVMLAECVIQRGIPEARAKAVGRNNAGTRMPPDMRARVDYLLGNVKERDLALIGLGAERRREKWKAVGRLLHTYAILVSDRLRAAAEKCIAPSSAAADIEHLTDIYNRHLALIGWSYSAPVPFLWPSSAGPRLPWLRVTRGHRVLAEAIQQYREAHPGSVA